MEVSEGTNVRYPGNLPDNWSHYGTVVATEGDASGETTATVEFASGGRQDIPASALIVAGDPAVTFDSLNEAAPGADIDHEMPANVWRVMDERCMITFADGAKIEGAPEGGWRFATYTPAKPDGKRVISAHDRDWVLSATGHAVDAAAVLWLVAEEFRG